MSTSDEIAKLHDLLSRGALTQAEFEQAKARLLGGGAPAGATINRFRLSNTEKWIGGVCGGFTAITGVDAWVWRLIFLLGAFAGGAGILIYVLLWILVPRDV